MNNKWIKTVIEIESVTVNGFAFASSEFGNVFIPKKEAEENEIQVGDVIYATLRENYPDKMSIAPYLCVRLDPDHKESKLVGEESEEPPQSPPIPAYTNVVPLVNGTELIHAAHDHLFLVLLDLPQKELHDMILDILHHDHYTSLDVICSILSVEVNNDGEIQGVQLAALTCVEAAIEHLYLEGKLVKLMRSTVSEDGSESDIISSTTTQRASDATWM